MLEAPDGARALELLETDRSIDLVFTDITLPGSPDGFALAQWIREHRPGLPVILTSGKVSGPAPETELPFFAKPCDYAQVAAFIHALLADS